MKTKKNELLMWKWLSALIVVLIMFVFQLIKGYVNLTLPSLIGTYNVGITLNFGSITFAVLIGYLVGWIGYKIKERINKK